MSLQIQRNYDENLNRWDFSLAGEVDVSTAAKLRAELEDAYETKEANMELDLTDLCYMDSTGLGVMIGAYGRMREKSNSILLLNPRDNIKKLLSVTSLDKVLCPEI